MMYSLLGLLICLLGISNATTLYGIYVKIESAQNENIVYTVSVDLSTGNFTYIAKNFVNVGDALVYNGISAFDEKQQILYYGLDINSDNVDSIDVSTGALQPSISIGASQVSTIVRDEANARLFITGAFPDNSSAIYIVPDNDTASELLNLTKAGVGTVVAAALNKTISTNNNGDGGQYALLHVNSDYKFELATFDVSDPKAVKSIAFPCGTQWQPVYITFDKDRLLGISGNAQASNYVYYEIVNGKCTTKNLKLSGDITSFTYDSTTHLLYMSYSPPSGGPSLEIYNTSSYSLSSLSTFDVLTDIEIIPNNQQFGCQAREFSMLYVADGRDVGRIKMLDKYGIPFAFNILMCVISKIWN